eukprot:maker-scaffold1482_size38982-snap-gene-0.11 protein:Tk05079 transcript:maker-scaffold1482_size38982-snap-gene-0.11-mRNA-1 annotation:"integrin alpha-9-like"
MSAWTRPGVLDAGNGCQPHLHRATSITMLKVKQISGNASPLKFAASVRAKEKEPNAKFCPDCAVLDPRKSHSGSAQTALVLGCGLDNNCFCDINVSTSQPSSFVIGSSDYLPMDITVANNGPDAALGPEVNMLVPPIVKVRTLPSECRSIAEKVDIPFALNGRNFSSSFSIMMKDPNQENEAEVKCELDGNVQRKEESSGNAKSDTLNLDCKSQGITCNRYRCPRLTLKKKSQSGTISLQLKLDIFKLGKLDDWKTIEFRSEANATSKFTDDAINEKPDLAEALTTFSQTSTLSLAGVPIWVVVVAVVAALVVLLICILCLVWSGCFRRRKMEEAKKANDEEKKLHSQGIWNTPHHKTNDSSFPEQEDAVEEERKLMG